jgi:2-keto-3-deoxy-L-fuconate dehydrogenase
MSGRVVVVTGSAGGIGTAIVDAFTAAGDVTVGLDIVDGFDVTDADACHRAAARIVDEHGRIDVLCNNAGVAAVGDVVAATPADWQRVFAVNVFGVAHLSAAALPSMRARGSGVVVNTCSVAAEVGLVERAVYSASKGAVLALTRAMAADELQHGIRVCCVSPGTVDGPWVRRLIEAADDPAATRRALEARQPMGRMVAPEEVAAAVVYLAAPTTFATGLDLVLDGGITPVRIVR